MDRRVQAASWRQLIWWHMIVLTCALLSCSCATAAGGASAPGHLTIPVLCHDTTVVVTTGAQMAIDEGGYDPRLLPNSVAPLYLTVRYEQRIDAHISGIYCHTARAVATVTCHVSTGLDLCRTIQFAVRLYRSAGIAVPTAVSTVPSPYPSNFAGPITPTPTPQTALQPTTPPVATFTPGPIRQTQQSISTLADGASITLATPWASLADPCTASAQASASAFLASAPLAEADCDTRLSATY